MTEIHAEDRDVVRARQLRAPKHRAIASDDDDQLASCGSAVERHDVDARKLDVGVGLSANFDSRGAQFVCDSTRHHHGITAYTVDREQHSPRMGH